LGNISGNEPRTAVGYNADKTKLVMLVVDGRNSGYTNGCNGKVLGDIMKNLGCSDALNFDGGGSSTMYFNGKVLNAARGNQRAVVDFVYFK
jgi:exopolysaccharide biosynthesis protein